MTGFVREVISERLLEFYQTNLNGTQPVILAMQASGNGGLSKYKYEGLIEENSISNWIKQIQERVAVKFYQSEEIPENSIENGVTVVVGHSFNSLVYSSSKEVLFLIYSPVDDSSGNAITILETLALKLSNSGILFAKMDGTSNEFEGLEMETIPTFFFFKGGDSDLKSRFENRQVFEGEHSLKEILSFVRSNSNHPLPEISIPEETDSGEQDHKTENNNQNGHQINDEL